jgi:DNA-binding transcriptional ArsR family regulator
MELIDRIRRDIQDRLDTVLSEADKLRKALVALDPRNGSGHAPRPAASSPSARRTTPSSTARSTSRRTGRRTPPGATKRRILDALADGSAKTAGEVASETGVARGTVSTTLSKLAKSGEIVKAERGYQLPDSPGRTQPEPASA